ncbi:MAG: caspase family protein [Terracidiphilus sp.]|jgi:hypothetical protein
MSDRAALIIGNSAYPKGSALRNPANDARDLAKALKRFGFATSVVTDGTIEEMENSLASFKKRLNSAKVGLLFFAGHGIQMKGENYLIAIDTKTSDEAAARHSSLPLNQVIETMEETPTETNIIILDACRNNPFERAWARSMIPRGLAPVYAPKGTLIAYATSPGQVAFDGDGENGAYTAALLQHLDAVDCSIETMLKRVRNTLSASTSGKQISWEHTSLSGEFYFNRSVGVRIDLYDDTALRDKFFVLDRKKASHRVIEGLKSHDWYTQNPALDAFTDAQMARAKADSLFVVGRNVYQAACGGSRSAYRFIEHFASLASGLPSEKWRALLDGMLFEVFFDSHGEIRKELKNDRFEEVFRLQQFPSLAGSFDFISECVIPFSDRFHVQPGRNREVALDVVTRSTANDAIVEEVLLGGKNIFWVKGYDWEEADSDETSAMRSKARKDFEQELATGLTLPVHLLKASYPKLPNVPGSLKVPWGWTVEVIPQK